MWDLGGGVQFFHRSINFGTQELLINSHKKQHIDLLNDLEKVESLSVQERETSRPLKWKCSIYTE
uniref:Uncharacterized protein n=1 Tax=Anguilla anguilla TaxID=7936 RepID=A0A0E9WW93_ANGAN